MNSKSNAPSSAFHQLHPRIQKWIWGQGWQSLRPTQEEAAPILLEAERDLIIAAATAGGKTEAAFLPLLSRLMFSLETSGSMGVLLYIAPLKALINDQYQRMELMVNEMEVPVIPWHGDSSSAGKRAFRRESQGVLMITPESLESLFVNGGQQIPKLFENLQHIVIDELHSFLGEERGIQLQSLLYRLELSVRRRVPRVGLSATLGDMRIAAEFLRPGNGDEVNCIISRDDGQELKLQIRGYEMVPPDLSTMGTPSRDQPGRDADLELEDDGAATGDVLAISEHLFKVLRGSSNLIFANSREKVEQYADLLSRSAESLNVPNEFFPHHGSLSKALREHAETALKEKQRPITAICTSTLEMGIDIGSVESVAQIGAPFAVSSLRQRLGRSGRRGDAPAVLRLYIQEHEITPQTDIQDRLRIQLFQSISMVELLIEGWIEPPASNALHLSTLIQQILSIIAQHGGATAASLWNVLCRGGPFSSLTQADFMHLLRQMGEMELLAQSSEGLLLHGRVGERITNHYSFYTAFKTPEEFTLANRGRIIGQLPIGQALTEGSHLIFAGKRWTVLNIDLEQKRIDIKPSSGGVPPKFESEAGAIHDGIRARMKGMYQDDRQLTYLDKTGNKLFHEGKRAFNEAGLGTHALIQEGKNTLVFPWKGDVVLETLAHMLALEGIKAHREHIAIVAEDTPIEVLSEKIEMLAESPPPSLEQLAGPVKNKAREKYDHFLGEELLTKNYASRYIDIDGAHSALRELTREQ